MIVKCLNVSYNSNFNGSVLINPDNPTAAPVHQHSTTATITFVYADADDLPRVEQFQIALSGVTEPLEYFPGEFYDLSLEAVAPPEPTN